MDLFHHFVHGGPASITVPANTRRSVMTLQIGKPGPDAEAAVRAIAELGRRHKVGKRLGAAAVIRAERAFAPADALWPAASARG